MNRAPDNTTLGKSAGSVATAARPGSLPACGPAWTVPAQKKNTASRRTICNTVTTATTAAIDETAGGVSIHRPYTATTSTATRKERGNFGSRRPCAAGRPERPKKANAATSNSSAARLPRINFNTAALWGALPTSSSKSGTKRADASSAATAIAAAAIQRARRVATGTSRSEVRRGESVTDTATQVSRSTISSSVTATAISCTPSGQLKAADAPMVASVNSNTPQHSNMSLRKPRRRAWRGEPAGVDWITRSGPYA